MKYSFSTILHIEDQDSTLNIIEKNFIENNFIENNFIKNSFKETGVRVFCAHTLQECQATLEKNTLDVILLDSDLLDNTTTNLTQDIFEYWPDIPVIVLSSIKKNQDQIIARTKPNNILGLINLPVPSSEFPNNIEHIILANQKKIKHKKMMRLEKLTLKYQKHLREIKPNLETIGKEIFSKKHPSNKSIQKLIQESHKIAGTAGTYGMREISEAAGDLEDALIKFDASHFSELENLNANASISFEKILNLINEF